MNIMQTDMPDGGKGLVLVDEEWSGTATEFEDQVFAYIEKRNLRRYAIRRAAQVVQDKDIATEQTRRIASMRVVAWPSEEWDEVFLGPPADSSAAAAMSLGEIAWRKVCVREEW